MNDGVGGNEHPLPGPVSTPAEVEVIAEEGQLWIEPAQGIPDIPANQHPCGADCHHVADPVLLALIVLTYVQAGEASTRAGNRDSRLQQQPGVMPAQDLRSKHRG